MVILACVQMVGSKLSILSFFHLVNFSERLEQAMVIQATWKKTEFSRKEVEPTTVQTLSNWATGD